MENKCEALKQFKVFQEARFRYRNHNHQVADRRVYPLKITYGTTEWYKEPQWLLEAWDLYKEAMRTFALRNILEWY